jgi:hypothetical protein
MVAYSLAKTLIMLVIRSFLIFQLCVKQKDLHLVDRLGHETKKKRELYN